MFFCKNKYNKTISKKSIRNEKKILNKMIFLNIYLVHNDKYKRNQINIIKIS